MDGLVKIWEVLAQPMPNMVLKPETVYAFDKEKGSRDDVQQQSRPNQYRRPEVGRSACQGAHSDGHGCASTYRLSAAYKALHLLFAAGVTHLLPGGHA